MLELRKILQHLYDCLRDDDDDDDDKQQMEQLPQLPNNNNYNDWQSNLPDQESGATYHATLISASHLEYRRVIWSQRGSEITLPAAGDSTQISYAITLKRHLGEKCSMLIQVCYPMKC